MKYLWELWIYRFKYFCFKLFSLMLFWCDNHPPYKCYLMCNICDGSYWYSEKNKNENQISEEIIKLIHSLLPFRTRGWVHILWYFFMFLVFGYFYILPKLTHHRFTILSINKMDFDDNSNNEICVLCRLILDLTIR